MLTTPKRIGLRAGAALALLPATALIWAVAMGMGIIGFALVGVAGGVLGAVAGFVGTSYGVKWLHDRALEPERVLARAHRRARRRFLRERRAGYLLETSTTSSESQPDLQ